MIVSFNNHGLKHSSDAASYEAQGEHARKRPDYRGADSASICELFNRKVAGRPLFLAGELFAAQPLVKNVTCKEFGTWASLEGTFEDAQGHQVAFSVDFDDVQKGRDGTVDLYKRHLFVESALTKTARLWPTGAKHKYDSRWASFAPTNEPCIAFWRVINQIDKARLVSATADSRLVESTWRWRCQLRQK